MSSNTSSLESLSITPSTSNNINNTWIDKKWYSFWSYMYLYEYFYTLIFWIIFIIIYSTDIITFYDRYIPNLTDASSASLASLKVTNVNIAYPYLKDTVSFTSVVLSSILPIGAISSYVSYKSNSLLDIHNTFLALVQGSVITVFFTEIGKHYAGRPRPYFLNACTSLDTSNHCIGTNTNDISSFPSGHSSYICFGMLLLTLYLCGKLKIYNKNPNTHIFLKLIVVLSPILAAWFVCISRTRDYHHNFSDIIGGAIIGFVSAYIVYFLHFPNLDSENCNMPLNPFIDYTDINLSKENVKDLV